MTLEARKALAVLLVLLLMPLGRWLLGPLGAVAVALGVGAGYGFYELVLREWFEG